MKPDLFYKYFYYGHESNYGHGSPSYTRNFAILPQFGKKEAAFKIFCLLKEEIKHRGFPINVIYENEKNLDFEFEYQAEHEHKIMKLIKSYLLKESVE